MEGEQGKASEPFAQPLLLEQLDKAVLRSRSVVF